MRQPRVCAIDVMRQSVGAVVGDEAYLFLFCFVDDSEMGK